MYTDYPPIEQFIQTRTAYADMYDEALRSIEGITPPTAPDKNVRHSLHLYPIRIDSRKLGISRNDFIEALKEKGIGASVHFIPLHMHPYYRKQFGYRAHDLPVAKTIYESMISLPLYPEMTEQDVRRVICAVQAIASKPSTARAH